MSIAAESTTSVGTSTAAVSAAALLSAAGATAAAVTAFLFHLRFNFFAAVGATLGVAESFCFEELLFADVENERLIAVETEERSVVGIGLGSKTE